MRGCDVVLDDINIFRISQEYHNIYHVTGATR